MKAVSDGEDIRARSNAAKADGLNFKTGGERREEATEICPCGCAGGPAFGSCPCTADITWWDFLSGGDGVRMKALIKEFNDTHPDIRINATTLEWGVPFYSKVQTAAAVGQQPTS